jgi:hypothetical protein
VDIAQDYERYPQIDRKHTMVHAFNYIDGLTGEVGDLLLLPGSHRATFNRSGFGRLFGTAALDGHIALDNLPAGSVVLAHSACLHGRRARPGAGPRYFVDVSYCEHVPVAEQSAGSSAGGGGGAAAAAGLAAIWCSYPNSADSLAVHSAIAAAALAAGHGRNQRYDWLYDTSCFYDQSGADDVHAPHGISEEGRIRRNGMSSGQEEAALAARALMTPAQQ